MNARIRVLLSAYACEPGKSSEQGVGWHWATELAKLCDVTVVTRSNNREAIDAAIQSVRREEQPRFVYHDHNAFMLRVKKSVGAHRLYYVAWQRSVLPLLRKIHAERAIQISHHITFASFRYWPAIARLPGLKVWGPVGGYEQTPWSLLPWRQPKDLVYEINRNTSNFLAKSLKSKGNLWGRFDAVLASTKETQALLSSQGVTATLFPTIGLNAPTIEREFRTDPAEPLRLLYVGNLLHLKGVHFAIEAIRSSDVSLTIVGDGSYRSTLQRCAAKSDVGNRVNFLGYRRSSELPEIYREHDVFIFPSLHDSGGIALLEAMSHGLAPICLDSGGPSLIVNPECGSLIGVSKNVKIVQDLNQAICRYCVDRQLLRSHGLASQTRVKKEFSWAAKARYVHQMYGRILGSKEG